MGSKSDGIRADITTPSAARPPLLENKEGRGCLVGKARGLTKFRETAARNKVFETAFGYPSLKIRRGVKFFLPSLFSRRGGRAADGVVGLGAMTPPLTSYKTSPPTYALQPLRFLILHLTAHAIFRLAPLLEYVHLLQIWRGGLWRCCSV